MPEGETAVKLKRERNYAQTYSKPAKTNSVRYALLSMFAVGKDLPKLATSAIAAKNGEADVALGNAIGSNDLNILAVLGLTAATCAEVGLMR
jgi:cation:H+ antiporter